MQKGGFLLKKAEQKTAFHLQLWSFLPVLLLSVLHSVVAWSYQTVTFDLGEVLRLLGISLLLSKWQCPGIDKQLLAFVPAARKLCKKTAAQLREVIRFWRNSLLFQG